jgi:hypothetical protein
MSHAHRIFAGTPQASLTPTANDAHNWPVDLGELADLRTQGAAGPVKIGFETTAGLIELGYGLDSISDLLPSHFLYPNWEETAATKIDGQQIKNPQERKDPIVTAHTGVGETRVTGQIGADRSYTVNRINDLQWRESGVGSVVILDGLLLRSVTHGGGTSRAISSSAGADLESLFKNLAYLRATRERPLRTYRQGVGKPQAIGYAGEWTATVLHRRSEEAVVYARLPNIPSTVEKAKLQLDESFVETPDTLLGAVTAWLKHLGVANSLQSRVSKREDGSLELQVTVPNQEAHNIVEIGFGISQVLPILTCGLLQTKGSLFVVDLPEAHLHPKPQSELADFFCSLALSGRNALVETHSEMFFHRLRTRSEMLPQLRNLIAVYFIDEPKNGICREPRKIGLGLDDETDWPAGFFQEGWDIEVQISSLRRARRS